MKLPRGSAGYSLLQGRQTYPVRIEEGKCERVKWSMSDSTHVDIDSWLLKVMFGIELEFWDKIVEQVEIHDSEDFEDNKGDDKKLQEMKKHNADAKATYEKIIPGWDKVLLDVAKKDQDFDVKQATVTHKGHGINYYQYIFTNKINTKESWWFTVTLDNGVLEIIAQPFSFHMWNSYVRNIANKYIYGIAENCGYKSLNTEKGDVPQIDGGGKVSHKKGDVSLLAGHLSVDYTSGFGGKLANVIQFILYISSRETEWIRAMAIHKNVNYYDPYNALYLIDLRPYMEEDEYRKKLKAYKIAMDDIKKLSNEKAMRAEIMKLMEGIRKHYQILVKNTSEAIDDDTLDEHYMGINTESIMKVSDPSTWRVELRRVIMPIDVDALERQLGFVLQELSACLKSEMASVDHKQK